jgi:hypothetical protein
VALPAPERTVEIAEVNCLNERFSMPASAIALFPASFTICLKEPGYFPIGVSPIPIMDTPLISTPL